jgi:hypothetical protein
MDDGNGLGFGGFGGAPLGGRCLNLDCEKGQGNSDGRGAGGVSSGSESDSDSDKLVIRFMLL